MKNSNNRIRNTIKNISLIIIGGLIFGGVVVYAETLLSSNQVIYDNSNSGAQSDTVQGALDELYEKHTVFSNLNNIFAPTIVTEGDGLYKSTTDKNRYIYRGSNPNNYIWLDENGDNNQTSEELYRIISFEADGTTKVIRNTSIGQMAWDTAGARYNSDNSYCESTACNVWGNTTNTYFNGATLGETFHYKYYPNSTSTTLHDSTNNGTVKNDSSLNTHLNTVWINSTALSSYIETHSFYVGGVYYHSSYTGGDKGIKREKEEEQVYTWNGNIGLMNVTEYIEASTNLSCTSIYSNYLHNSANSNSPCNSNNWLKSDTELEWTITALAANKSSSWSYITSGSSDSVRNVRPSFYLKSSIKLTGIGTIDNPYKIL